MHFRGTLLVTVLLMICGPAVAQIPQTMHYQGALSDSSGTPLTGAHTLVIALYDQASGGAPLWAETLNVELVAGVFSVTLGNVTPLNLPFDRPYWLGTAVDGGPELIPRSALAASPYSLNAHANVAEPQPGQGLVVRDSLGVPTHIFQAEGGVWHTGQASFEGGNDTGVVVRSDSGIALVAVSGDSMGSLQHLFRSAWTQTEASSVSGWPILPSEKIGVVGVGAQIGVKGNADQVGVQGVGLTDGVQGVSPAGVGVRGFSDTGEGVRGGTVNGFGVSGSASSGVGGGFIGQTGILVVGDSIAGSFTGDVTVQGEVYAQSLHVATFDSAGNVQDTLTNFHADGSSTFNGPVQLHNAVEVVGNILDVHTGGGSDPRVTISGIPSTAIPSIQSTGTVQVSPNSFSPPNVILNPYAPSFGPSLQVVGGTIVRRDPFDVLPPMMVVDDPSDPDSSTLTVNGNALLNGNLKMQGSSLTVTNSNGDSVVRSDWDALTTDLYSNVNVFSSNDLSVRLSVDADAWITSDAVMLVRGKTRVEQDETTEEPAVVAAKVQSGSRVARSAAGTDLWRDRPDHPRLNRSTHQLQAAGLAQQPVIVAANSLDAGASVLGFSTGATNSESALWGTHTGGGAGVLGQVANTGSSFPGVWAATDGVGPSLLVDHSGASGDLVTLRDNGVNQARIDKTGKGFFNGGTQTGGADIAEAFAVTGDVHHYEPGDVISISVDDDRTVGKSREPYSRLVIGVYATRPGVLLTERSIDADLGDMIPVGVVGVLPTKVTREGGPIQRGDMLVTSSTPGHAMKGNDWSRMHGATIGKALEPFDGKGPDLIRVLVNVK